MYVLPEIVISMQMDRANVYFIPCIIDQKC